MLTKKQKAAFLANPTVNPLTGRSIVVGKPTHDKLVAMCGKQKPKRISGGHAASLPLQFFVNGDRLVLALPTYDNTRYILLQNQKKLGFDQVRSVQAGSIEELESQMGRRSFTQGAEATYDFVVGMICALKALQTKATKDRQYDGAYSMTLNYAVGELERRVKSMGKTQPYCPATQSRVSFAPKLAQSKTYKPNSKTTNKNGTFYLVEQKVEEAERNGLQTTHEDNTYVWIGVKLASGVVVLVPPMNRRADVKIAWKGRSDLPSGFEIDKVVDLASEWWMVGEAADVLAGLNRSRYSKEELTTIDEAKKLLEAAKF